MTDLFVYSFMLSYQQRYGCPPKLRDILQSTAEVHHRSSIFYSLHRLIEQGKVKETKPQGYARRYEAVP